MLVVDFLMKCSTFTETSEFRVLAFFLGYYKSVTDIKKYYQSNIITQLRDSGCNAGKNYR